MSYQVLARKWRPQNFEEMVGQDHVLRALTNALDENRLHHAYLFTGTRGVGKTTVARNFAKALNCEQGISSKPCGKCQACTEISEGRFIDLIEVDAASRTKVEDTRELLDNVLYAPTNGRFKVYLIDEVHMLSAHSFNALLKTLEEPPPHVKFLLATTDPQKLPVTILSRCLQFNMKPMSPGMISDHLTYILGEENITFEATALNEIAHAADGSMRDALSLLDQAIAYGHSEIKTAEVREMLGTVSRDQMIMIVKALVADDLNAALSQVDQLAQMTPDYDAALSDLLKMLHQMALLQTVPDAVEAHQPDRETLLELSQQISADNIQLYYQVGLIGRRDLPLAPDSKSGFEMILMRMLAFRPVTGTLKPSTTNPAPSLAVNTAAKVSTAPEAPVKTSVTPAAPEPVATEQQETITQSNQSVDINSDWHDIVNAINVKGMAKQLALNCELQGYEEKYISLNLNAEHNSMVTPGVEESLRKALSEFLGRDLKLKFNVGTVKQVTPAQVEQQKTQDQQQMARRMIDDDPVVQALKDNFGATVIEESVKPTE